MTRPKSSLSVLILVFLTSCTVSYAQESPTPSQGQKQVFWARKLTATGKIVIEKFGSTSTKEVDLSDLEIWQSKVDSDDPLRFLYFDNEPDWKLLLLSNGYARLKDESKAATQYVTAQNTARDSRAGLWAESDATESGSWKAVKSIVLILLTAVLGVTGWWGGAAIYHAVRDWQRWHQVPLILLGRPSTGKSWLWRSG